MLEIWKLINEKNLLLSVRNLYTAIKIHRIILVTNCLTGRIFSELARTKNKYKQFTGKYN